MNPTDQNIYAPPAADHAIVAQAAPQKLYSARHVALAAFIGSPLAGCWLLAANFGQLGNKAGQQKALLGGLVGTIVLLLISFVLPENFPNMALPAAYVYSMFKLAEGTQGEAFRQHLAAGGLPHSGWRAAGIGVAGLVLTVIALLGIILVLPEGMLPDE